MKMQVTLLCPLIWLCFPWTSQYDISDDKVLDFSNQKHLSRTACKQSEHAQPNQTQPMCWESVLLDNVRQAMQGRCGKSVYLNLSSNNLTGLPASLFNVICPLGQLPYLEELNLSHNQLQEFPNSLPNSLLRLNVSFNRISQLRADDLKGLPTLTSLDLSHNVIAEIDHAAFPGEMKSVKAANFSHNRLRRFEPWPYLFSNYAQVDLSHNAISSFTNEMNFTVMNEFFGKINLSHNNVTHIYECDLSIYLSGSAPSAFVVGLRFKFDFRYNPMVCDCHLHWLVRVFDRSLLADVLEDVVYANSYIQCAAPDSLKNEFLGFLKLHPEKLLCNITEGCPEGCYCADTPQYEYLAISCDPVLHNYTLLPSQMPGDGWVSLNLSGHALKELKAGDCNVSRLRVLDVSSNQLQELSASFLDAADNLQELNLRNNELTSLPFNLQKLPVGKLYLTGNPLRCSCELMWFGNWVKAVAANISFMGTPRTTVEPSLEERILNTSQPKRHVSGQTPDAMLMTCFLPSGKTMPVVATSDWELDCTSAVAVQALIAGGVMLVIVMVLAAVCWRWRYNVQVLMTYAAQRIPHCSGRALRLTTEETADMYEVFISMDEADRKIEVWVTYWLLPLLENRGHNSLRVYLPLRQELPGVCRAESRVEAISQSRKVLVILTEGYVKDGWCRHEFDHACRHLQEHNYKNLVVLVMNSQDVIQKQILDGKSHGPNPRNIDESQHHDTTSHMCRPCETVMKDKRDTDSLNMRIDRAVNHTTVRNSFKGRTGNSPDLVEPDICHPQRLNKKQLRERQQLEQLSQYMEDGQSVALEPLRSFLMDGHYVATSDWLFKYKFLYELSTERQKTDI